MEHLISAVRELRARIGDSQQAFATRLGMSIRAIANYEKDRLPSGKALYLLEHLARAHGQHDLAMIFARALAVEMDWMIEPEQPVWAGVVRELVRNRHICQDWEKIAHSMVRELEGLVAAAKQGTSIQGHFKDQESNIASLESLLVEARYKLEGSAERMIELLADEYSKRNPEKTREQARAAVVAAHPELYIDYRAERAEAARGTQFEQSLALNPAAKEERAKGRKKGGAK